MKAVVLAYHNIGCAGLEALLRNGFEICAVFTHCDDKNENTWFRSVAELAAGRGIPVFAPEDINHPLWVEKIRAMRPDFIFSFYYRKLVKRPILEIPPRGCLNLHSSLLPKYRGRCPINWTLVNGESETGVTLHYMTERADDGDIVGQARIPIADQDTALALFEKAEKTASDILDKFLPMLKSGAAPRLPQDHGAATYFGGRRPEDGKIDWSKPARETANLVRAVTKPYPGAYFTVRDKKVVVWQSQVEPLRRPADPGRVISADPFVVACGESALKIVGAQVEGGIFCSGPQAAAQLGLVKDMVLEKQWITGPAQKKKVLILGVNGFIGNALSEFLLDRGGYEVHGMDLGSDKITRLLKKPDFYFFEGDISIHREWIEYHVRKCDIILPLVAIATPIEYTRNPLRVFSLDFEENLRIVRYCAKYRKRIVFPSTSEVYGMCDDNEFDEDNSRLILGPIRMQRWIYSCSKQLLDRVIWAYGRQEGLKFTLFRPFNWIGPRLDSLMSARIGSSRAITQLILNLVEGSPILLVDGGAQKRCFTDVKDGVDCLCRIIENKNGACDGQIFNIGNPDNEASIAGLADILVKKFEQHPLRNKFPPCAGIHQVESRSYYGQGYQDVEFRKPSIRKARSILGWNPAIGLEQSVEETLDFFLREAAQNASTAKAQAVAKA